ncbi:MAG: hypothetical protein DLM59_19440 [Pseudonocardiales bacterium]|nr:MAG: hypothetical protein DLM59_19440 [Pseudonocardiales bacterium]
MATSSSSVDGLVSGLDSTAIITQLMALERQPQNRLKVQLQTEQTALSGYQAINTKVAVLLTATRKFTDPLTTAWNSLSVASSSATVSASATFSSTSGQLAFDVLQLAVAHAVRSDTVAGLTAPVASAPAGIDITLNSGDPAATPTHITLTDGSLQGVVAAINAKKLGVSATAVQVSDGVYRLQLASTTTGAPSQFTVTGLSIGTAASSTGTDAQISVGSGAGAYTVTSHTNTFGGVLPGVTFTVSKLETGVTLVSSTSGDKIADAMQAMVDAANAGVTLMKSLSSYDTTAKKGSVLSGDYVVGQLRNQFGRAISTAATGGSSLKTVGVQVDRDGVYLFDRAVFLASYQADPVSTQNLTTSLATTLQGIATKATTSGTGTLNLAVQGRNAAIKTLTDGISGWDDKLAVKQAALQRRFAALEVTLGKLKNQSNWLAGQIGSLSTSRNG